MFLLIIHTIILQRKRDCLNFKNNCVDNCRQPNILSHFWFNLMLIESSIYSTFIVSATKKLKFVNLFFFKNKNTLLSTNISINIYYIS